MLRRELVTGRELNPSFSKPQLMPLLLLWQGESPQQIERILPELKRQGRVILFIKSSEG